MADEKVNSVDTSIYRQQPQPNPLDTIGKLGGALDTLGEIEVGKAQQSALNPQTGEIDRNELARMLQQTVAGSRKAIPTLDALEKLKQAGFATDQAGLETYQKRMAITNHLFSGPASKPKPTIDDIHEIAARALAFPGAKEAGITLPVIMNVIKQFRGPNGNPLPPDQIKAKALEIQTQAATAAEIAEAHSPRHQVIDRGGNIEVVPMGTKNVPALGTTVPKNLPPTTEVATPGGRTYLGEQAAPPPAARVPGAVTPGAGLPPPDVRVGAPPPYIKDTGRAPPQSPLGPVAQAPTGPAATLRPGYEEAQKGIATAGAAAATNLTNTAAAANRNKALLGNLEDSLTKFTSGKGTDWKRVATNFINANLPVPDAWKKQGGVLDEKSLASQEEFNKTAQMIAQSQFTTLGGTGTDAKLESAISTSPNELLSLGGNKGIIRMLKGNEDAIIAQNKAWQSWKKKNGPDTYDEFQADFQQKYDPRAFQFQYLSPKDRTEYIAKMDAEDKPAFLRNLTHARKEGWIRFDMPAVKAAEPAPAPKPVSARTPTPSPPPAPFNDNGGWPRAALPTPGAAEPLPSWAQPPSRYGTSR